MGGCLSTRRARRRERQQTTQIAAISLETLSPEYNAFKQCYDALVTTIRGQVGDVSTALFSKGLISETVLNYVTTDGIEDSKKARKMVESVSDCIKVTPSRFHDFIAILEGPFNEDIVRMLRESFQVTQKVEQLEPVAQGNYPPPLVKPTENVDLDLEVESIPSTTTRTVFVCPYCEECSPQQFFSKEGCPRKVQSIEIKSLFPYLDVTGVDNDVIINLEEKLISDTRDIIIKFGEFSLNSRESLEEKNIPLDRIQDCILSAVVVCTNQRGSGLDTKHKQEILAARSIASVFSILRVYNYISFLNYHIIELLVQRYGSPVDKQMLDKYLEDFKIFCQRNVFEVPQFAFSPSKSRETAKVFSIKCTEDTLSLEEVLVLKDKITKIFDVESSALQLCSVKKGCVELGFVVSAGIFAYIFPLSSSQQSALSDLGVRLLPLEESTNNMEDTSRTNSLLFQAPFMPTPEMFPSPVRPPRIKPKALTIYSKRMTESPVRESPRSSSLDRRHCRTKHRAVGGNLPRQLNEPLDSGYSTAIQSQIIHKAEVYYPSKLPCLTTTDDNEAIV